MLKITHSLERQGKYFYKKNIGTFKKIYII